VHAGAVPLPGPWLEPFQDAARAHRMGLCFSVYERDGAASEVGYNTGVLLGPDGRLIGTYRKVHLALIEVRRGVTAGDDFPVFDVDGVRVGMAICMDSAAQETYRILAQRGAEVVLMPIMGDFRATPWKQGAQSLDVPRWKLIQEAHAFDNHLYVAAACNVNQGSAVTAPWGQILAYNDGDRDLIWADLNVDERRQHPLGASIQAVLWAMRRPAVYGSLADSAAPVAPPALRRNFTPGA
jgi:predicted amidohydrolase